MRSLVMLYGVVSYFVFFAVFVYLIAFVGGIFVPKTLSSAVVLEARPALLINISLMLLWGIQHTVMAREWFKKAISSVIPHHIERSTYVLISSVILIIMFYYWQPMEGVVWQVENTLAQQVLWGLFGLGWVLVLISTFLTNHFDLFGLRQSWLYFVKRSYTKVNFTERFLYSSIRHPMMLGILIAFWAIPVMTMGHLVFSIGMSVYVIVGIYFEEKGLVDSIGEQYQQYQQRTSKVIPKIY